MLLSKSYPIITVPALLSPASILQLQQDWDQSIDSPGKVILLKGQSGTFCEGMDPNWVSNASDALPEIEAFSAFLNQLMTSNKLIIAMIDGKVTGGGMGLVAACDFAFATSKSSFQLTEGLIGLVPGVILTALLNRLTPRAVKQMVFSAAPYGAAQARALGLIDQLVTRLKAEAVIAPFIKNMTRSKKQSIGDLKKLLIKAKTSPADLNQEGIALLHQRLTEPAIRNRFAALADWTQNNTLV